METQNVNINGNTDTAESQDQAQSQLQGKTFTQEEVNQIVRDRLARAKQSAKPEEPSEKELELQQRECELYLKEQLLEKNYPSELAEQLKGLDKKTVNIVLDAIAPYVKKSQEPILNAVSRTEGGQGSDSAIRKAMGLKG